MQKPTEPGTLVISLDFELQWGMFDKVTIDSYGEQLRGVHTAIPRMLSLFTERNIHATWATVGMLMADNQADLDTMLPITKPNYQNPALSAYTKTFQLTERFPDCFFAPDLVRQIVDTPGQELASHTFAHIYSLETQEHAEETFAADAAALNQIAKRYGVTPTSIVFPRNQWSEAVLQQLPSQGITCYRGTENHFLYRARPEAEQTNHFIRALRLLDHYLNLSGHHTYRLTTVNSGNRVPINIPASRFLRPYSKRLAALEPLRLHRIKRSMTHAARRGEIFHLWWHPHNFGADQEQNFNNLITLLDHFTKLQIRYGMVSRNMSELTN